MKRIQFSKEINLFKPAAHYYAGVDYLIPDETYRDFVDRHCYNGFEYIAFCEDFEQRLLPSYEAKELLVYITGSLGDSLWHTALIHALKKRMPECEIDVVVDPSHGLIWEKNKDIRSIKCQPFVASALDDYDAHLILDEYVSKWTHVGQPNCYEALFAAAGLKFSPAESFPHLTLTDDDEVRAYTTVAGLHNKRGYHWYMILGLHASSTARNLSAHQWFEIASRFAEKYKDLEGFTIYGLSTEPEIANEVHPLLQQIPNYYALHNAMDIRSLAAFMRRSMGLVSLDTMHVHLAAAVNCPTVAIMSTVPGQYRTSTYPLTRSIDNHKACPHAPCFWKRADFRYHKGSTIELAPCYTPERTQCEVTKSVTVKQVEETWNAVTVLKEQFDGYDIADL